MSYVSEAKIAVGHNNVAGLQLVSSISVGGQPLYAPVTIGTYSGGVRRYLCSGRPQLVGLRRIDWRSYVSVAQYEYLRTTYAGASGVTVRSTAYGLGWSNYNAYVWFDEPAELEAIWTAGGPMEVAAYLLTWHFTIVGVAT